MEECSLTCPPLPPKLKWIRNRINAKIPSRRKLGLVAIEQQIRKDGMHRTSVQGGASQAVNLTQTSLELFVHKRLHPSAMMSLQKPNKTLRKPDWPPQHEAICAGFSNGFISWQSETKWARHLLPRWPTRPPRCGDLAVVRHGNQKDFCLSQLYNVELVVIY
jgi:hypothetical protein